MTWSLATYRHDGTIGLAVLRADGSLVAPVELKQWASMLELVDDWPAAEPVLRGLDVDAAPPVAPDAPLELLAPLRWPRKVVCAGVNYRRHMQEMGGEIPAEGWRPFFFLKAPTTSVIGPHDPIVVRAPERARYDWEAELAAVIGVGGRDIPVADALAHVAGYCVANDVTARGLHRRQAVPAEAFTYDWFAAKSADGSLPLGPGITPAFQVPDPQALRVRLWVNGELQQDDTDRRHGLHRGRASRGGQRGGHPGAGRRHPDRDPGRGGRGPRPVPAARRRRPGLHRRARHHRELRDRPACVTEPPGGTP